jgi:hypothetical protein
MNELFDVEVEEKERRKAAFAWFHKKKISGAKALAIGAASIVALSTPVVLFASRNNSPTASVDTTVASGDYVTTTTLGGESSTSIISGNGKKAKGGKLPVLVLPVRGSAPTGATSTTLVADGSSTSTSIVAPPAPPIVLSPSSTSVSTTTTTIAPGSISRTISFTSTSEVKTYGDSPFTVSATASIGSGDITYTSSNSAVCTVSSVSGEVSIVGTGSCEISAAIPASGTYAPASSLVPVSVTVNKASLTITASSASIAYSPRLYVVTAAYKGFVNGDDSGVLTTLPTCAVLIPGGVDISSVGRHTYATSCSGAVAPNYDISYVGGVLSVSNWS